MYLKSVDHISIVVSNLEENVRFYRDILGFSISKEFYDEKEKAKIVFLSTGNTMLELIAPDKPVKESPLPNWEERNSTTIEHIAFAVDNIEETVNYLKSKGVEFILGPINSPGVTYGYFKGPDGILLEIIKWG